MGRWAKGGVIFHIVCDRMNRTVIKGHERLAVAHQRDPLKETNVLV